MIQEKHQHFHYPSTKIFIHLPHLIIISERNPNLDSLLQLHIVPKNGIFYASPTPTLQLTNTHLPKSCPPSSASSVSLSSSFLKSGSFFKISVPRSSIMKLKPCGFECRGWASLICEIDPSGQES
ncbi:hypothetical protein HanXRQr2_Chr15g0681931 [Helianthus annuus]|uniref:Uncharacterized protein n=1 Tax=Helianthus annuus TaxID=4232 RepID=A0A9K3DYG1_HELAN|nr:hypothetical protein HanXRQr2_Chr15g0681931 [Helianthus annuus]